MDNPYAKYVQPDAQGNPYAKYATAPETTLGGVAGGVTRGLAPYAAGAAFGAALGAPFAGVGAIPGALAGTAAVGLTELGGNIYNKIGGLIHAPHFMTPSEASDQALDAIGTERPDTAIERIAQATSSGIGGVSGMTAAANQFASSASNPVMRGVLKTMGERPKLAAASGASSGASGQSATELGAPEWLSQLAAFGGGILPYGPSGIVRSMAYAPPTPEAVSAAKAGYALPPNMASEDPSAMSKILAGWAGKTKLQQAASAKNQDVTNRLANRSIGLPDDTTITETKLKAIRDNAGKSYEQLAHAIPEINADNEFRAAVGDLGGRGTAAAKDFPALANNDEVDALSQTLGQTGRFSPEGGIQMVRLLRSKASANFKNYADPAKQTLALAQRQAADAIDGLIERNLAAQGKGDLVSQYRDARTLIARTHDVQAALNDATGDISARDLARLMDRGRPLSAETKTAAQMGTANPKAVQNRASFGDVEPYSILDLAASLGAGMSGHYGAGAAILGRPAARALLLSKPYQNAMMNRAPFGFPVSPLAGSLLYDPTANR